MISVYKIEDKIPLCFMLFVKILSISVADTFFNTSRFVN